MKILLYIIIFLAIIYLLLKRKRKEYFLPLQNNIYLLNVKPYVFPTFAGDTLNLYSSYFQKTNNWVTSIQQSMKDMYQKYFQTEPDNIFLDKLISDIKQVVKNDSDDVYNWILLKLNDFNPIPSTYKFYTYEKVDTSKLFYMNHYETIKTLKDAIDISIYLKTSLFVYDGIISILDQSNSYENTITSTPFNSLITDVIYTYFDPMDIYINPNRYTLNMGIGLMDTTQPSYTIYIPKNQLQYLDHLLKVSSKDTPIIHSFFEFPNYKIIWDDEWIKDMLDIYGKYISDGKEMTDAFQKTLSDFTKKQLNNYIEYNYKTPSIYFKMIPSEYYWIIILLSLFDPSKTVIETEKLFQYIRSASYDPKPCYDFCDNDAIQCMNAVRVKQNAYNLICNYQPKGTPQEIIDECINENRIISDQAISECNGDNKDACRLHCLTDGSNAYQFCSKNSDCPNNSCGRLTADDFEPLVCCPGETINYAGFDYCKNMPNGSVCFIDKMCANNNCANNWYGLKKGLCQ